MFYIFFNLNGLTINNERIVIRMTYASTGATGVRRRLNTSRQPAAVMGRPMKYSESLVRLNLASLRAPQAMKNTIEKDAGVA